MRLKRAIVTWLERACNWVHPVTHRRPWLWLRLPFGVQTHCPLADLSDRLAQRWGTGQWGSP